MKCWNSKNNMFAVEVHILWIIVKMANENVQKKLIYDSRPHAELIYDVINIPILH